MKPKGWPGSVAAKESSEKRTRQVFPSLKNAINCLFPRVECRMVAVTLFDIVGGVDAMEMSANC